MARIFTVVSQPGAAWLLRRTGKKAEQLTPAQMVGRRGDDELLLWLAGRYVELRPDCIRRPPLAAAA